MDRDEDFHRHRDRMRYSLFEPRDQRYRSRSRSRGDHRRPEPRDRRPTQHRGDDEDRFISMAMAPGKENRRDSNAMVARSQPPSDKRLAQIDDDPRQTERGKVVKLRGGGRNTASFDPESTLQRPEMRIIVEKNTDRYPRTLSHDDVVIVPDFLCQEDDWTLYYQLIEEMRASQAKGDKGAEWISWHEGAHLISKNPAGSATYQLIQDKISKYFDIPMTSVGTRFNWYRDSSDWKPYHHDSAAFNPARGEQSNDDFVVYYLTSSPVARNQNITVGISLGSTRELSFLHAANETTIAFPQTNGMLFSFGRDVNIRWKHGIRAVDPEMQKQEGRGRVSIILWGNCPNVKEEVHSPPMLPYQGEHKPQDSYDRQDQVCRDFARNSCRYGDRCRFRHV